MKTLSRLNDNVITNKDQN